MRKPETISARPHGGWASHATPFIALFAANRPDNRYWRSGRYQFNGADTVFEPENSLEALMQAAGKDPGIASTFYRALLDTEIYVLTPEAVVKPGRRRSLKFQERMNMFQSMT